MRKLPALLLLAAMTTNTLADTAACEAWARQALPHGESWQVELLARARDTIEGNIVRSPAWGNRRAIIPAHNRYEGFWNWDSAFHVVAVVRWDPALAREQVQIMFDLQLPNGMLPDVMYANGKFVKESGKPPVFPWAIETMDRRRPDLPFVRALYPKLVRNEAFWRAERLRDGLFFYGGEYPHWESGWDDSVRWDDGVKSVWAIDLNCYMVSFYDAMIYFAKRLNLAEDAAGWSSARADLVSKIEAKLWNAEAKAYADYDYERKRFLDVLTPASFMPLYVGFAPKDRAEAMARLAADRRKFYPGMPTVAYDHPKYSGGYWRGPCWLNTAAFAIQGLRRYGFKKTAAEIRETVLRRAYDGGYPYEYYDATTGKPAEGAAARFGWSAAWIVELLLDWK